MSSYYLFSRFESFNSYVRMYNVFGNRLAPSRNIAKRFYILYNTCVTYVTVGMQVEGMLSIVLCINLLHWMIMFRCGDALKELFFTPFL